MNIDGATAVTYAELGFAAPLTRGLFCLSRSVGVLAHAWEQTQQGGRIKGPLPRRHTWTYDGPALRAVPDQACTRLGVVALTITLVTPLATLLVTPHSRRPAPDGRWPG